MSSKKFYPFKHFSIRLNTERLIISLLIMYIRMQIWIWFWLRQRLTDSFFKINNQFITGIYGGILDLAWLQISLNWNHCEANALFYYAASWGKLISTKLTCDPVQLLNSLKQWLRCYMFSQLCYKMLSSSHSKKIAYYTVQWTEGLLVKVHPVRHYFFTLAIQKSRHIPLFCL